MLLSEFIERTGVTPSAEEYAKIEANYYEFAGDKDQFCRAWVKVNPAAVKAAKAAKALQAKKSKLFTIVAKLDRQANKRVYPYCWAGPVLETCALKAADLQLLKDFGISVNRDTYFCDLRGNIMSVYRN
ncbi:MAG: hypothetical protein K2H46_03875 [Muribaculaceae bacterium]|nr:hypothetical protein [Muribaculaceae bacterium]